MIARVWRGAVRKEDSDAYSEYMQETGVAGYAKAPGNRGVWMLRRDVDERTDGFLALGVSVDAFLLRVSRLLSRPEAARWEPSERVR